MALFQIVDKLKQQQLGTVERQIGQSQGGRNGEVMDVSGGEKLCSECRAVGRTISPPETVVALPEASCLFFGQLF